MTNSFKLSLVIPLYNEEATISLLFEQIQHVVEQNKLGSYEVIFIDDGSTDQSWAELKAIYINNTQHIQLIRFRRNFGKAEALQAGFDHAKGEVIITMDADLQDDPAEIPAILAKLHEGYDMISGWKKIRHDPIDKTLPSKIFNALARAASGVQLNDFNCGFKAYRHEVTQNISLFGELHRFIPILAHAEGFKVAEIPVKHRPREHGISKYGSKRFLKGLLDLITVVIMARYMRRPAHVFGSMGLLSGSCGFTILAWLSVAKIVFAQEIGGRPLFFLGILLMLLGAQLLSIGLIAEMITRLTRPDSKGRIVERFNSET